MTRAITPLSSETLHMSCVAIDGHGVLIEGPSGAGKSDLALRLIDRGAVLVSDDYTVLTNRDGALHAAPPTRIAGLIEVRGLGLITRPFVSDCAAALLVSLSDEPERLPETTPVREIAGVAIPVIVLRAADASAPIKVEIALQQAIAKQ